MTLDVNMVATGSKDVGGELALGEQDTVGFLYGETGMLRGMSSVISARVCTCSTDALQSLRSSVLGVSAKLREDGHGWIGADASATAASEAGKQGRYFAFIIM